MRIINFISVALAAAVGLSASAIAQTEPSLEEVRADVEARMAAAKARTRPGDEMVNAYFFMEDEPVYPARGDSPDRGGGPYSRLVIRGVYYVAGTGAPARGPVDIVVEGDRIAAISGTNLVEAARPSSGDREIDATGMYILPGFINSHSHTGPYQVVDFSMDYIYKLWLAHGLTTVRAVGSHRGGLTWTVEQSRQLEAGDIDGPDLHRLCLLRPGTAHLEPAHGGRCAPLGAGDRQRPARGASSSITAPRPCWRRRWARPRRWTSGPPCTMRRSRAPGPTCWIPRAGASSPWSTGGTDCRRRCSRTSASSTTPPTTTTKNEEHRFQGAARILSQAAPPGSDRWNEVMDTLVERDFNISPTFAVKEATRDVMAAARREWHDTYTMPWQWKFYTISRKSHGSFFFDWTSEDEAAGAEDYRLGMAFVNEFKNRGGRVTAGSDAGYVWCLYGFCYVRELELLQEAGFNPLEVLRAATLHGAEALGIDGETGSIEVGKKADLVIVGENPLDNFKVLYGTGALRLDADDRLKRVGGVEYTVKDGIVYDAKALLGDVREMVAKAKAEEGIAEGALPLEGI